MTNWTISQLDRKTADGFVTTAHWQATAVDGEHTASIYSTCSWADGTVNTPYADLTQATVLGWVWANGLISKPQKMLWRLRLLCRKHQ